MEWKFHTLGAGAIAVTFVALAVLVWTVMAEGQRPMHGDRTGELHARQEGR